MVRREVEGQHARLRCWAARRRLHLVPFEQGEIGPDLFRHPCLMGLEVASAHERRNSVSAAMFTPGTSGKYL